MNMFSRILRAVRGPTSTEIRAAQRRRYSAIVAANRAAGRGAGYPGVQSNRNEDELNKQYLYALGDVIQRSQDLDINNPDVGGFHITRTAQVVGAGVAFEHSPHPEEVNVDEQQLAKITTAVNRIREIHSRTGGFDSTNNGYTEGKQQERAFITMLINGCCLIHRVWRPQHPVLPIALELIPGVRISTPYDRAGSKTTSYGVEYADSHRTEVVGYWVRRVSTSVGDSFVPEYEWDFIPAEDCALLSLTQQAGLDRSLPMSVRITRMARNRGEFIESSVESARAQAAHYGVTEVAPGANAFDAAEDDFSYVDAQPPEGVKMLYTQNGEKVTWSSAKLPDPDFTGFMDKTDERMARGVGSSLSRWTRKVNSSYAGGRLEDQQDIPIVNQLRESLVGAWQKVNQWVLEAIYLTDAAELPGYCAANAHLWNEWTAVFPGMIHINPTDTQSAREKGLMQRSTTPQRICKEDGLKLRQNLIEWAKFYKMQAELETEYKLEPGKLDILLAGKSLSTAAGQQIAPPSPETENDPAATDGDNPVKKKRSRSLKLAV